MLSGAKESNHSQRQRVGNRLAGIEVPVHGATLRRYLWFQFIAGWLLSAILVAGATGQIRSDR